MRTYPSIENLRPRDLSEGSAARGKIYPDKYQSPVVESMAALRWIGHEKLDGTGVRILHNKDGELVIRGRKEKSQLPPQLLHWFEEHRSRFVSLPDEWCLYGEGIGPGIQKGGENYGEHRVVAFDMQTPTGRWLTSDELVAWSIGKIDCAPMRIVGNLLQCEEYVASARGPSLACKGNGEGIICRPQHDPLDAHGKRIIVKIKGRDYVK